MEGTGRRLFLLSICTALTIVIRMPYALNGAPPDSDFACYDHAARDLLQGGLAVWSSHSPYSQDTWNLWPPAYPAWLALLYGLTGGDREVAFAANLLLAVVVGLLLLGIGNRVARGGGWVAWALWALAPQAWLYSGALASENLALPLLLAAIYLALRRSWWAAGLAMGLLVLTRAALLPLAAVMIAAAWGWRRDWRHAAAALAGTARRVAPGTINRSRSIRASNCPPGLKSVFSGSIVRKP
jgi:hypothetical protein